jgi:hypothetical protein
MWHLSDSDLSFSCPTALELKTVLDGPAGDGPRSSYLYLPSSWDYRYAPPCLAFFFFEIRFSLTFLQACLSPLIYYYSHIRIMHMHMLKIRKNGVQWKIELSSCFCSQFSTSCLQVPVSCVYSPRLSMYVETHMWVFLLFLFVAYTW